jgi:hypothetical protein
MALDRDIYWVGRQWAVTGLGIQLVDQRLKGAFDIEVSRVWEDDISERMRAHAWLKVDDFDKALSVARERFPEPPRKRLPLVESVLEMIQPASAEENKPAVKQPEALAVAREVVAAAPVPVIPPAPAIRTAPALALRIDHASAKFLPQWKIRTQGRTALRR